MKDFVVRNGRNPHVPSSGDTQCINTGLYTVISGLFHTKGFSVGAHTVSLYQGSWSHSFVENREKFQPVARGRGCPGCVSPKVSKIAHNFGHYFQ